MCNLALKNRNSLKERMEKHDFVTIADITKEKILYMIEMIQHVYLIIMVNYLESAFE